MGTGAPITGSAGTSIVAQFSRVATGTTVLANDVNQGLTSCVDDLATIATGAHDFAGVKDFLDPVNFHDTITIGQSITILADGTGSQINGTWTAGGDWTNAGTWTFNGTAAITNCPVLGTGYSVNVTGATNATPIVITAASHNLVDGQQVIVASVGGNTNANGTWTVDVLSSSTFSLIGSAGNSNYTSGGTVTAKAQVKLSAVRTDTRALTSMWNDGGGATPASIDASWFTDNQGRFKASNSAPTSNPQYIGWDIELPQGAVINSVTVCFTPKSGHGAVPATVPEVNFYKLDLRTGAPSSALATASDPNTGSTGAYQVFTALTATPGTPEITDKTRYRYYVVLTTETGTDALEGITVQGAYCSFSVQFLDQF